MKISYSNNEEIIRFVLTQMLWSFLYTLSYCSGWIHPGEFPGKNLACKPVPAEKGLSFHLPDSYYIV